MSNSVLNKLELNEFKQFLDYTGITFYKFNLTKDIFYVDGWLSSFEKTVNNSIKKDDIFNSIHKEDIFTLKDQLKRLIRGDITSCDITIRFKFVSSISDYKWIRFMAKYNSSEDVIFGVVLDTTDQRKSLYDFSLNLSLLNTALELSNISGLYFPIDENSEIKSVHFFASLFQTFDIKPEDLTYKNRHYSITKDAFRDLIFKGDLPKLDLLIESSISAPNQTMEDKVRFRLPNTSHKWYKLILSLKHTPYGDGLVGAIADINEDVNHLHNVEFEATHDKLTFAQNRLAFSNLKLKPDDKMAVIFIDLDDFKNVNDLFGHDAGDIVLVRTVERLANIFDPSNVFRAGGDEFIVIVQDYDLDKLILDLKKIIKELNVPVIKGKEIYKVGCSVGVSMKESDRVDTTFKELLEEADYAMYKAKRNGKNKFFLLNPKELDIYKNVIELENKFKFAFEREEITSIFLPIYDNDRKKIIGVEALARWKHNGKIMPADDFLDITNKYNLMYQLDRTVIDISLKIIKNLINNKLVDDTFKLFINLSSTSLRSLDINSLKEEIMLHNYPVSNVCFEITEEIVNDFTINEVCKALRGLGFKIILDDYNLGNTAIDFLIDTDFDYVKLDHKILPSYKEQKTKQDFRTELIYKHLKMLVHNLGIEVISEGVESDVQIRELKNIGIRYMQGYGISKPLLEEDLIKFIKKHNNLK